MNSVDKLRTLPRHGTNGFGAVVTVNEETIDAIADEIEAEIKERYQLLPVDADGVPVRPREKVSTGMGEHGPIEHLEYWHLNHWVAVIEYKPGQFTRYDPAAIRHVKPRTLEDVLADFAAEVEQDNNTIETARRYADEIRELLGGDAE